MSTAWFRVIESLQGSGPSAPRDWSARRVHRIADDALPTTKQAYLPPRSSGMSAREGLARPTLRSRCPCTECVAKAAQRGVEQLN